jgi:4-diphosphocytidyl-2-C-methyl-D-erythritol kinase
MLTLFSPAKINLFLRILGKRPDGYHELASLFQAIGLGDRLTFTLSKEDNLTCSDPLLPTNSSNLVLKAVNLFRLKTGLQSSIQIHLEKKIPTQAGLGGGSSNAATTLWALNALHHFPYTEEELQQWSSEIGSDIPFFFSQGIAYCTGRGEIVRNLPLLPLPSFSIEKPSEGLSTPAIYNALNLSECSSADPETLLEAFYKGKPTYINDLEAPALRLSPTLSIYKKELLKKYDQVFMTGSGSAHVCLGKGTIPAVFRKQREWFTI